MRRSIVLLAAAMAACGPHAVAGRPPPVPPPPGGRAAPAASSDARPPPACPGAPPAAPVRAPPRQVIQSSHAGMVSEIAFSSGGHLATVGDGSARIWDVKQRALFRAIPSTKAIPFQSAAWATDEDLVLGGANENVTVDLAGHERGRKKASLRQFVRGAHGNVPSGVDTEWGKGSLVVTEPGGKTHRLTSKDGDVTQVLFDKFYVSEGWETLVGIGQQGTGVAVWSLAQEPSVARVVVLGKTVSAVALSPHGDAFAVTLTNPDIASGSVEIVQPVEGGAPKRTRVFESPSAGNAQLAFAPDGGALVVASFDGVRVFDLPAVTLRWADRPVQFSEGTFTGPSFDKVAISPDGALVAATTADGAVRLYDAKTGRKQGTLGARVRAPRRVEFAGAGRVIASSYGHATIWSLSTGEAERKVDMRFLHRVVPTSIRGDVASVRDYRCSAGHLLLIDAWHGLDAPDRAFDPPDAPSPCPGPPQPALVWPPPPDATEAVPMPGDYLADIQDLDLSRAVAVLTGNPPVLQDLQSGARTPLERFAAYNGVESLPLHGGWVQAFSMEKSASRPKWNALFWDAKTGKLAPPFAVVEQSMGEEWWYAQHVATSDDGATAAASAGTTVAIRPTKGGDVKQIETGVDAEITALLPSRGDVLVGTYTGMLARIRDGGRVAFGTSTGGPIREIIAEGGHVVTRSDDGAVRVWDGETLALLATLVDFADDESIAFTRNGAFSGTADVADRVAWAFDDPAEVFRFEQFASYRDPAAVARRLGGGADVPLQGRRPPRVEIVGAPEVRGASVHLRAHASSLVRVDTLRAYVEGRPAATRAVCAADGVVDFDLPLLPGLDAVDVTAFDDAGFASNPAVAKVAAPASSSARPDLWVVAIGVSDYPKLAARYQLALADDDAQAVAAALQAHAGDRAPYAAAHVDVLLNDRVTVASVDAALAKLSAMKPDDVAVVFFAGHGVRPTPTSDMLFLTSTTDATPRGVEENGVGWSRIGAALSRARGRVLLLLDACHSGALSQDLVVPNGALAGALLRDQRAGVVVFAAAKGRQVSFEPSGTRGFVLDAKGQKLLRPSGGEGLHGFFTAALLASLSSGDTDTNADGALQLGEIVDAVTDRVTAASRGAQTPWVARRELFGDFRLVEAPSH